MPSWWEGYEYEELFWHYEHPTYEGCHCCHVPLDVFPPPPRRVVRRLTK